MEIKFEWDEEKEKSNIKKHGLSFKEAATDTTIRIISARGATKKEEKIYVRGK